jgi:hypothetical protein
MNVVRGPRGGVFGKKLSFFMGWELEEIVLVAAMLAEIVHQRFLLPSVSCNQIHGIHLPTDTHMEEFAPLTFDKLSHTRRKLCAKPLRTRTRETNRQTMELWKQTPSYRVVSTYHWVS